MLQGFEKLNSKIRYGALGNLYGLTIYLVISLIAASINIPNNLHTIDDKLNLIYLPIYYEVSLFEYSILFVVALSIGLTVWNKNKVKVLPLLRDIASNTLFAIILFPGALITLGIISLLLNLMIGFSLFYLLAIIGKV